MSPFLNSLLSVLVVSAVSLVGFFSIRFQTKTLHSITYILVSFAVGALFGDVFFHLLPEMAESGFSVGLGMSVLVGLFSFFIIEKFVHWRHCHEPVSEEHQHPLATVNLIGDGLHNFLDGLLIAGSYAVNPVVGMSTTLAVFLHELPQEIGDFGVLIHSGMSVRKALFFNFVSGLLGVLAVVLFYVFPFTAGLNGFILPIAAGGFLYLAGSDLVPELHKETKIERSLLQVMAMLLGVFVMYSLTLVE